MLDLETGLYSLGLTPYGEHQQEQVSSPAAAECRFAAADSSPCSLDFICIPCGGRGWCWLVGEKTQGGALLVGLPAHRR